MVGGEKLKEVGQVFGKHHGSCLLSPLNMAPVCVSSYSWVIFLSLSHTNPMSPHTPFSPEECPSDRRTMFWSISQSSQCFQVIFHASQCSREVSPQTNHSAVLPSFILMSVHTHLIYHLTSLSCVSFMSMMGDTSWPSFDESVPVDFNTLSRN
jgi:hypothetical protein